MAGDHRFVGNDHDPRRVHPPAFPQHFHDDHPVFSCSISEHKQLNTWVSFRSATTTFLTFASGRIMANGLLKESGAQHRASDNRLECGVHGALTFNQDVPWGHSSC